MIFFLKALISAVLSMLEGKTPQRNGNVLKREDSYKTTHAFVPPNHGVYLKFEVMPEGKQTNILHIQVLCGVFAIGENRTDIFFFFFLMEEISCFLCNCKYKTFLSILTMAHLERMDFLIHVNTVCSVLVRFGLSQCWSEFGSTACALKHFI